MKLEYLYVDGYKGLKELSIYFKEQSSPVSIDFLIGRNGSGKSSVIEALGLIFTRIMQDELPGFHFEMKYRMRDGTDIYVKPEEKNIYDETGRRRKLYIEIAKYGEVSQVSSIPNEYLPDRIISYCSGANNSMEEILITSPRESLASDLYDLSILDEEDQDHEEKNLVLSFYEQLDSSPRVIYLDAVTSKIVLPVMYAVLPLEMQGKNIESELKNYCGLRKKLASRLNMNLIPVAFSFKVYDEMLGHAIDTPQIGMLRQLMSSGHNNKKGLSDCIVNRSSSNRLDDDGSIATETVVVFRYTKYDQSDNGTYYHPGLQKYFDGNPFVLMSALLTAYREGIIGDIHFSFRNGEERGLYGMEALSDGELMWLARTGLVLLAQRHCGENTLFLYDEPDVHFNDDWNRDFIKVLYDLSHRTWNEFLIATHSTLILTDAMYEQLNLFDNRSGGRTEVCNAGTSTFAVQRDEISKLIFDTEPIGAYAADAVKRMMGENNLDKMKENIGRLGPGYQRFRLYEQLYSMLDEKQD